VGRRKATYRTLVDLLAVTDMRIGEAIGLNRNAFDANCGVLTIRNGKFGKSLELPLHRVRSPLMSSEMEVALRSSGTRTTVPSSGLLSWVKTIRRQWHGSPPHRPIASRGIACQGISGKGILAQSVALEAAVCQSG
jgi:integrase